MGHHLFPKRTSNLKLWFSALAVLQSCEVFKKNTDVYFPPSELPNESLASVLVKPVLGWVSKNSKELVLILLGVTSSYAKKKKIVLFYLRRFMLEYQASVIYLPKIKAKIYVK